LAFVQDVLNTAPSGRPLKPDLLADVAGARTWLAAAVASWSLATGQDVEPISLTDRELPMLREFRDDLRSLLNGDETVALPSAVVTLRADDTGFLRVEPRGKGGRAVVELALVEILEAQRADRWRRLKTCRDTECGVSFYDRSRNNSGAWHDVHVCGNAANLRAYRARKRAVAK
jgi:predicted RNA-binding Zn ribbon-like protein